MDSCIRNEYTSIRNGWMDEFIPNRFAHVNTPIGIEYSIPVWPECIFIRNRRGGIDRLNRVKSIGIDHVNTLFQTLLSVWNTCIPLRMSVLSRAVRIVQKWPIKSLIRPRLVLRSARSCGIKLMILIASFNKPVMVKPRLVQENGRSEDCWPRLHLYGSFSKQVF